MTDGGRVEPPPQAPRHKANNMGAVSLVKCFVFMVFP
jgi:hypothetical protein